MLISRSKNITTGSTLAGRKTFIERSFGDAGSTPLDGSGAGLPAGTKASAIVSPQIDLPLLDGFVSSDPRSLNRMYREIYRMDGICGTALDFLSTLPFSDFSLIGMNDERKLQKFAESVERLRIAALLPVLSIDYLVLGKFIGTLNWNQQLRIFDAMLPQNIDLCTLQNVPIFGADPIVTITLPDALVKAIQANDPRMARYIEKIPAKMREKLTKKGVQIDPEDLIYVARPGTVADFEGVSALTRVLPIWLQEKALLRGSMDQFWKRQRATLHIQIGDDNWEPTAQDYEATNSLFLEADHDPGGAIITTRYGINTNEIRRGDDFLKWSDLNEQFATAKMRGIGISESFLTGEGTLNNVENTISVTLQHFANYRDMLTRELFYDRTFPAIAIANGFRRSSGSITLAAAIEEYGYYNPSHPAMRQAAGGGWVAEISSRNSRNTFSTALTDYVMPKVQWHNSLTSDQSSDYLDMLEKIEGKGVPIPLRMWAAAGGLQINSLAEQKANDLRIRKFMGDWLKEAKKLTGDTDAEGGDGGDSGDSSGGGGFEFASALANTGSVIPVGLQNREFDDSYEPHGINGAGKRVPLSPKGKRMVNEKMNKLIAEAAANAHAAKNYKEREKQKKNRKRSYSIPTKRTTLR